MHNTFSSRSVLMQGPQSTFCKVSLHAGFIVSIHFEVATLWRNLKERTLVESPNTVEDPLHCDCLTRSPNCSGRSSKTMWTSFVDEQSCSTPQWHNHVPVFFLFPTIRIERNLPFRSLTFRLGYSLPSPWSGQCPQACVCLAKRIKEEILHKQRCFYIPAFGTMFPPAETPTLHKPDMATLGVDTNLYEVLAVWGKSHRNRAALN